MIKMNIKIKHFSLIKKIAIFQLITIITAYIIFAIPNRKYQNEAEQRLLNTRKSDVLATISPYYDDLVSSFTLGLNDHFEELKNKLIREKNLKDVYVRETKGLQIKEKDLYLYSIAPQGQQSSYYLIIDDGNVYRDITSSSYWGYLRTIALWSGIFIVLLSFSVFLYMVQIGNPVRRLVRAMHLEDPNKELESIYQVTGGEIGMIAQKMQSFIAEQKKWATLASIGQSTAMIAHDMRRPLASVKALLNMLPSIKDDPVRLEKMAADVDQTITRTNAMLNEVMDFSRDSTALELKECAPKAIFAAAVSEALRNHPEADVEITYQLDSEHVFRCDVVRVTRLFANLIDNAIGAMEGKGRGRLCIKTGEDIKDKRFIIAQVRDSGGGIPEEYLPKIFDPFFTKGKKSGTGLGLAICQKIANMHGGDINAWNALGSGAVFSVRLPAGATEAIVEDDDQDDLIHDSKELKVFRAEETRREPLGDTANTAEFMRINKQRGRISTLLVVDDEPLFRETIRSMLNTLPQVRDHVKVIEADSAEMGLRLFDETTKFDYVIADIDLGKNRMNGYKLTQAILALHPDTYVLIHSNRRRDEMDEKIRLAATDRFLGFLPKPMKADELLQFLACKSFETSSQVTKLASQQVSKPASQQVAGKCHFHDNGKQVDTGDSHPSHAAGQGLSGNDMQTCRPADLKTALLLNDDEGLIFCFSDDLKKLGYQVLDARNVSSAMEHFVNRKIDMIVSDINLGDLEPDGYDFLTKVREKDPNVPFVFTSGYNRRDEWDKAREAGATEYLQIPYELHELKKALGV